MICFAAFTPHSPLLLEQIGKENSEKLLQTEAAFKKLSDALVASKPDVILVIATHNFTHDQAFHINLHDSYSVDLKAFGDMSDQKTFLPDVVLGSQIRAHAHDLDIPFTLESNPFLDYGASVPLLKLTKNLPHTKIVPVAYSNASEKEHYQFGQALKDVLIQSDKRVAIIASGDLSHCLSSDAPLGFKKEGDVYDQTIIRAVKQLSSSTLLGLDKELVKSASECSQRTLLILFGILDRVNMRPEVLSYEHPFGVGYLVAQFHTEHV